MTHEEYKSLKGEIFAEADRRYVVVDDCNERQENISKKLANDDKRIDILILEQKQNNRQQKINNWLTTVIVAGIISLVIKVFLGG